MTISRIARKLKDIIHNNAGLFYVSIGFAANTILGGLFWFYIASIIEVDDYGLLSYLIAGSQIITTVGVLGLGITQTTYIAKGVEAIIPQIRAVILISSAFLGALTHVLFGSVALDFVVVGTMYFTIATSEMLGKKKYREFGIVNASQKVLQILISIGLMQFNSIEGILAGFALSYMAMSYRFYPALKQISFRLHELARLKIFITSSFSQEVIRIASLSLDKIFIGAIFGYVILGMYTLAFQLLLVLATIPNILFAYLLPHDSSGNLKRNTKVFGIGFSAALAVMMTVFGPSLLTELFPKFTETPEIIRIISFTIIPMTISSVITSRMLSNEKAYLVIVSATILVASQFSLLYLLGSILESIGIAIALLLAYSIEAIVQFILMKRFIRDK